MTGVAGEASDYTTIFTFDGRDRLVETLMPRGNAMAYGYEDGTNRLLDTIRLDAAGNQLERHHLTLNVIGDTVTEEDQGCAAPAPTCASWTTRRSESFAYDVYNRLAGVLHPVPAGSRTFNTYDLDGQLSTVQDEDHASPNATYSYDALHRMISVRQTLASAPGGAATTSYAFDVMDNLSSVTDPNGNATSYRYDDFHRLERQDSPVTGTTTYQYDPAGNLIATTDARGAATARTYDASNRVLTSTSQLAGVPAETVTYSYDGAAAGSFGKGRLAQMTDPSGATAYAYERRGLLKSEARTILGSAYGTAYQYDANANRGGMTYPSGRQATYTFDFADRPFSAASGTTTYVASASYLPFGPEAQLVFGNGTTQTRSYDLRYRPVENRLDGSAAPIADYLYSEDPAGNITSIHDALDATFNRDFTYDDLFRLTGAATGDALWGPGGYQYDAMGNMTALALGSLRTAAFSYNGTLPTLSSVLENGVSRPVTYDPAGNEVAVGSGTFTYSSRNLLTAGDGLAYTYDGRGVRVAVQVVAAFGTITGTVVDQNGQPLAGVTVQITGTVNATATDGAGNFNLTAPAGLYTLKASKFGFLPATTTPFTLTAGGSFAVGTICLQPAPGKITGTVVTSLDGSPLAGAAVSLAENGDTAFADASGNVTLTEPAGTYTSTITAAGYASQTLPSFALAAGTTHPLGTITLVANPATLSGHVTSSAGGAPIAGATVTAMSLAGAAPHAAPAVGRSSQGTPGAGRLPRVDLHRHDRRLGQLHLPAATRDLQRLGDGARLRQPHHLGGQPRAGRGVQLRHPDPRSPRHHHRHRHPGQRRRDDRRRHRRDRRHPERDDHRRQRPLPPDPERGHLPAHRRGGWLPDRHRRAAGARAGSDPLGRHNRAVAAGAGGLRRLRRQPAAERRLPDPLAGLAEHRVPGRLRPVRRRRRAARQRHRPAAGGRRRHRRPAAAQHVSVPVPAATGVRPLGELHRARPRHGDPDPAGLPGLRHQRLPDRRLRPDRLAVRSAGAEGDDHLGRGGDRLLRHRPRARHRRRRPLLLCRRRQRSAPLAADRHDRRQRQRRLPAAAADQRHAGGDRRRPDGRADRREQPAAAERHRPLQRHRRPESRDERPGGDRCHGAGALRLHRHGRGDRHGAGELHQRHGRDAQVQPRDRRLAVALRARGVRRLRRQHPPAPGLPGALAGRPERAVHRRRTAAFDAGAVRLDNPGPNPLAVDSVVVDLQRIVPHPVEPRRPPPVFNLWGSFVIPAHGSAILTQTAFINFDTSDYPISGAPVFFCIAPAPNDPQIPKITVTIGGQPASYLDTAHIIDTFGVDRNACGHPNESLQWRLVNTSASDSAGQLALLPAAAANPLGALYTATAVATDAGGSALAGVTVLFTMASGPNAGLTSQAVTDANGVATFSYTGTTAGTDTLSASITNASGGLIQSSSVTALWLPTVQLALSPPSATQAVGTPYNATVLATDASNQPVAGLTVTFQIASGPNAGKTAKQTTGANGQTLYSYTSATAGTDTLTASIGLQGGNSLSATPVTATWTSSSASGFALAPLSQSLPVGTAAGLTATLLGGNQQPIANQAVALTVTSGPDAGTTGKATTNAAGVAAFSFTGPTQGSDLVQATTGRGGGMLTSNPATIVWTAVPTAVTYTGPSFGDYGDPLTLSARLTAATTGQPLAGQTLGFTFGTQTLTGVTDATGTATVTLTPTMNPGPVPLGIVFAGSVGYGGSAASMLVAIHRDDTALVYTGPAGAANGQPQAVTAVLTDAQSHAPLVGKTVTFTFGSITASGTTDATGTATATLTLSASVPTGPALLQVAFAGDAGELPAATTAPVVVYEPASFVLWGGNTPGLALGQYVNFWGSQWASQVTGGDYQANPSFKGYAIPAASPIAICEPTAHTSGSPQLDSSCWTSKPGNSTPPATLPAYIGVIVSTSIAKQGSTIYGNIAALVVVQVDPNSPYGSDPGHPGYGTIAAVIQDGVNLFPHAAPRRQLAPAGEISSSSSAQNGAGEVIANPAFRRPVVPAVAAAGNQRFFFYSPDLHLLAESELTTSASPTILTEYIWFADRPVAQSDTTGATSWTSTDHLGTPLLQTSAAQGVTWRAEYEPYGAVFGLRSPDQHQPLRLPGQEAEQLAAGANGMTERSYNIHRWYEAAMGRYAESDPLSVTPGAAARRGIPRMLPAFLYASARPTLFSDPLGWLAIANCGELESWIRFVVYNVKARIPECLNCWEIPIMQRVLDDLEIECVSWAVTPGGSSPVCGARPIGTHRIALTPPGLNQVRGCGCLEATIFHEAYHIAGHSHDDSTGTRFNVEFKCFPCGE